MVAARSTPCWRRQSGQPSSQKPPRLSIAGTGAGQRSHRRIAAKLPRKRFIHPAFTGMRAPEPARQPRRLLCSTPANGYSFCKLHQLTHPNYRAAMLADVLAGESPAGVALPGSTVVISAVRKGDQLGESADVKVLVGWCAGAPVRWSDPPGGRANGQAVAKVQDHKRTRRPRKSVPARSGWRGSRARRALDSWAKAIVVGEEYIWERAAGEHSGGADDGMFGKSGRRKHGTTRGSPRRSRTAKALRITGTAGKSRRACEWGGWGRLSDDGAGQNNPYRSEGPWGKAACAARMAASNRAGFLDSDRGFGAATEDANVGSKPEHGQGMPRVGLTCTDKGKAPTERPALEPYWGKLAVRNLRGDDGNVGII